MLPPSSRMCCSSCLCPWKRGRKTRETNSAIELSTLVVVTCGNWPSIAVTACMVSGGRLNSFVWKVVLEPEEWRGVSSRVECQLLCIATKVALSLQQHSIRSLMVSAHESDGCLGSWFWSVKGVSRIKCHCYASSVRFAAT